MAAVLLAIVYASVYAGYAMAAPIPAQATPAATPDLQTILSRMEQAQTAAHAQNLAYTVTRSYQFFGADRSKLSSQVVAQVEYQPPATKSFTIKQTSGSGQGPKIVKQVLQHESDAAKNSNGGLITRANYDFEFVRTENLNGAPCYVLKLDPKHDSKDAVRGQAWVDANSYLIRHVEGDLTKSPSWWVKDVHVVMDFGRIAGIWLQTATLAVANVRFLGRHSMLAQNVALTVMSPAMLASSGRVVASGRAAALPRVIALRKPRMPISYAAWGDPAIR
jgi:hypothetical protein